MITGKIYYTVVCSVDVQNEEELNKVTEELKEKLWQADSSVDFVHCEDQDVKEMEEEE